MKPVIVVTSISAPNAVLTAIAQGATQSGFAFVVAGDTKSPRDFALPGCRFLDFDAQLATNFRSAAACPSCSYARKNVGYLIAIAGGAGLIIDTDDDNFPRPAFFAERTRHVRIPVARQPGWLNIYRYFSDANIWPRGLPLNAVGASVPAFESHAIEDIDCPIQQGLADENPDVDAVYRLILPLPQRFRTDRRIALDRGAWCPINSQNTSWWPDAFPLLYLPAYCSFRMTDIWRGLVAQRIAWENGWYVLFHGPTVWQARNEHDLMRDFADEVAGYLHNDRIRCTLEDVPLAGGKNSLESDLRRCYEALVKIEVIESAEMGLLDCWLADLERIANERHIPVHR
jgi:hypothetical protein